MHWEFGHSSASIAQPFKRRLPISEDALSDWSRRRLLSSVSGGNSKVGELRVLDTSVGGVEAREIRDPDETLGEESEIRRGGIGD